MDKAVVLQDAPKPKPAWACILDFTGISVGGGGGNEMVHVSIPSLSQHKCFMNGCYCFC